MTKVCNVEVPVPSAPELVLDLLTADGGTLSSNALCRAGALMGIRETTLRVGLTRLAAEGKIGRGERGEYRLDHALDQSLDHRRDRQGIALSRAVGGWHHRPTPSIAWQGDWLAVHDTSVQRADKTAWRHHALALRLRGFAVLGPGLHLRPDNRSGGIDAERTQLFELGLSPQALVFRLAGLDDAAQTAARKLWNIPALTADCRRLQLALERSEARLATQPIDVAVRESLLLGRAVIAHLIRDPLLPPELMSPAPRDALLHMTQRYQGKARALWRQWLALPTPRRVRGRT